VLHQPGITSPIVGVTKVGQLDQLVGALEVKLDAAELKELSELYQPHEMIAELPRPGR
jgi:aryl-alcohol dehydrogenase (NADP+)